MFTHRYAAAIWLTIYVALQVGAAFISPPAHSPAALLALALLSAALFMFLALAVCASLTLGLQRPRSAAIGLAVGTLGLVALTEIGRASPLLHGSGVVRVGLHAVRELIFILTAVSLGALITHGIRDRNILLPAAVFAAFADYLVVHYGVVHWALTTPGKGQKVLNAMSAHVPSLHPGLPVLTVGFADFLFLSIFFACVYRFHLRLRETFLAFFVLLTMSLWVVVLRAAAIPALAPMALGFVAANFRCFKLSREELQAMGTAAAIVLVAALVIVLRQPHPRPPAGHGYPAQAPVKATTRPAAPGTPAGSGSRAGRRRAGRDRDIDAGKGLPGKTQS